jgi:hypothetical protein
MTPKEKAIELFEKYDNTLTYLEYKTKSKQCALIAVDEIIKSNPHIYIERVSIGGDNIYNEAKINIRYWKEVKIEIEKL